MCVIATSLYTGTSHLFYYLLGYYPTPLPLQLLTTLSTPLSGDTMHTYKTGDIYSHFQRKGLFIIVKAEQRIAFRSIDNGYTYYINRANLASQYTPVSLG